MLQSYKVARKIAKVDSSNAGKLSIQDSILSFRSFDFDCPKYDLSIESYWPNISANDLDSGSGSKN